MAAPSSSACPTVWRDADGDGFTTAETQEACGAVPVGWRAAANGLDCYDQNRDAHPGQMDFFADNRGDGSWDYNCDGRTDVYDTAPVYSCGDCSNTRVNVVCGQTYFVCPDTCGDVVAYTCTAFCVDVPDTHVQGCR